VSFFVELTFSTYRLYVKGAIMGFKRGMRNQYEKTSLIKIDGLKDKKVCFSFLLERFTVIERLRCNISCAGKQF